LTTEPSAGESLLQLDTAPTAGWQSARVILPGTNQETESTGYQAQWEELTSTSTSGSSVNLAQSLAFNHRGARDVDGNLNFLPHVGNLSRNVVIRSANPSGTRGHVLFVHQADVDIRYTLFQDLGRTTIAPLDSTTFDGNGMPTHLGTNQIGR